jgi:hypothetical protein
VRTVSSGAAFSSWKIQSRGVEAAGIGMDDWARCRVGKFQDLGRLNRITLERGGHGTHGHEERLR